MSVILGGIDLNPNLVLKGIENKAPVHYSIRETLGGADAVQIIPNNSDATITLSALLMPQKQGWFCTSQIEEIYTLANQAIAITLSYNGTNYSVYILEVFFEEWYSWEPPNDNKRFSGDITLQVV